MGAKRFVSVVCGLMMGAMALPASATIIGGAVTGGTALTAGGVFQKLVVPFTSSPTNNTIGDDNQQSPNLFGFDEEQNIIITSTIQVNIGTNPVAGDVVASHYIGFDPASGLGQVGYIDFDADIYGVATDRTKLNDSDFLANTGVTYLSDSLRGLEGGDSVMIDPTNSRRLLVNWFANSPGDYVRVFTQFSAAAVPAPPGCGISFAWDRASGRAPSCVASGALTEIRFSPGESIRRSAAGQLNPTLGAGQCRRRHRPGPGG